MCSQTAYKFSVEVQEDGRVTLEVPFPSGARLTVFIVEATDPFDDLLKVSESSLEFWDNSFDDEDWRIQATLLDLVA